MLIDAAGNITCQKRQNRFIQRPVTVQWSRLPSTGLETDSATDPHDDQVIRLAFLQPGFNTQKRSAKQL